MNETPETINVLQVLDKCAIRGSPIHGVSRLLLYWWPAFRETDINLSLCVLRGGHGTCDAFEKIGVEVEDLARSKVDPRTVTDLVKIIKRDRIDVLHCHGYGATTFGRIAGLLTGTPALVHEHMVDSNIPQYQKAVDKLLARYTARGIAISKAVSDFMTGPRGLKRDSMEVVYNSIPDEFFREITDEEKDTVIARYNIPKTVPIVGIVGRLDPIKGHDDFLSAAVIISGEFPDAHFVIVGDGELRDALQQQAKSTGMDKQIQFVGHCDDVLPIVSLFDVFVSTSLSEGLGMAHIEAMAQGKPVVATAVGGVPEIIEDKQSGLLVPPRRPDKLARAVIKVLKDKSLQTNLGDNALRRIKDNFTIQRSIDNLSRIYHEVLEDR